MDKANTKFFDFFSHVYKERWEKIFKSLQAETTFTERPNKYHQVDLKTHYKMDPASILVAQALEVKLHQKILDLCAAPGGKTLILAEQLDGTGELISNEISAGRRDRLKRVLHEYLPFDKRQNCFVKGLDGNQYGLRFPNQFDGILADVPCSGERHLLENQTEFNLWSEKRSINLATRQFSLLSSAWLACRVGGRIVYSTCSLSPYENDKVVEKLVKRRSVSVLRLSFLANENYLEKTEFGYQILPDTCGFGPMYFSILKKEDSA